MADVGVLRVLLAAFGKGVLIAFAAAFIELGIFSEHFAKAAVLFGIVANFALTAVENADLNACQAVEILQKLL